MSRFHKTLEDPDPYQIWEYTFSLIPLTLKNPNVRICAWSKFGRREIGWKVMMERNYWSIRFLRSLGIIFFSIK